MKSGVWLCAVVMTSLLTLVACRQRSEPSAEQMSQERPASSAPASAEVVTPVAEAEVIGFHGFGPARFGDAEESVRISWGRPLQVSGSEPKSCRQLFLDPRPASGVDISFMLVDDKFARYDVDSARYTAPGGGKVGSSVDEVLKLYAGRVEQLPHKYVEGAKVLVVSPANGGAARLLFETNAEGKVNRWRIGVPPAVDYVEGCS